jgi:hypothetical protein
VGRVCLQLRCFVNTVMTDAARMKNVEGMAMLNEVNDTNR